MSQAWGDFRSLGMMRGIPGTPRNKTFFVTFGIFSSAIDVVLQDLAEGSYHEPIQYQHWGSLIISPTFTSRACLPLVRGLSFRLRPRSLQTREHSVTEKAQSRTSGDLRVHVPDLPSSSPWPKLKRRPIGLRSSAPTNPARPPRSDPTWIFHF